MELISMQSQKKGEFEILKKNSYLYETNKIVFPVF